MEVTTEHIIIATLAALLLVERLFYRLDLRNWQRERQSLLNRVQANTLESYAALKQVVEPDKHEAQAVTGAGTGDEYDSPTFESMFDARGLPETAIASAQAAADSILSGV